MVRHLAGGTATLSASANGYRHLLLEGKDDDGLSRTFIVPVINGGKAATTLSWHTTSITTGKTWFKDVRVGIEDKTVTINTHRARDADSVSKLVSTSKLITLTVIYGIR